MIENEIMKEHKKNDLEIDTFDKDDKIDSIEVDVKPNIFSIVNFVN